LKQAALGKTSGAIALAVCLGMLTCSLLEMVVVFPDPALLELEPETD
jgi:hypothetical protein